MEGGQFVYRESGCHDGQLRHLHEDDYNLSMNRMLANIQGMMLVKVNLPLSPRQGHLSLLEWEHLQQFPNM
jgi:hypothetical protein